MSDENNNNNDDNKGRKRHSDDNYKKMLYGSVAVALVTIFGGLAYSVYELDRISKEYDKKHGKDDDHKNPPSPPAP